MPRTFLACLAGLVLCACPPVIQVTSATDSVGGAEFHGARVESALQRAMEARQGLKSDTPVVTVVHARSATAPVVALIRETGGQVEAVSGDRIQARLTSEQIRELAGHDAVGYLRLPYYASPRDITSEGLDNGSLAQFAQSGHRGEGVRIAVLDVGFSGYVNQLGRELPNEVIVKNFNGDGFETTRHGTAVAEIIHDAAPEAELLLVSFRTDVEYSQALAWIRQQSPRVHVVNASIGFDNVGPLDGTGTITREADRLISQHDILYVNSAGNERENYYSAQFNDPDGNGWHNFQGSDEFLEVTLNGDEPFDVVLNWDDWGVDPAQPGASRDYDLFVWCPGANSTNPEDACLSSTTAQSGLPFDRPLERIRENAPTGGSYRVGIRANNPGNGNLLRLFASDLRGRARLEYKSSESTLTLPADGFWVLSVGAYFHKDPEFDFNPAATPEDGVFSIDDWQANLKPEPFSSKGPTWDGRVKPDLTGPDCVSTASFGTGGFCGTSASAPYVAAAAALLKSEVPSRNAMALRRLLIAMSEDVKPFGADNEHGAGRLDMSAALQKPRISARSGLWNNAQQQGHGFFIEVRGERFLAIWYVYDSKGAPYWLMSVGDMSSDTLFEGEVLSFRGPGKLASPLADAFDPAGSTVSFQSIGTLRFEFTGDATATVDVALTGDENLAPGSYSVKVSQFLTTPAASSSGLSYASPYSGLWHLPSQNGHGFFINRQGFIRSHDNFLFPTDSLILTWFGYDRRGDAFWLLGAGRMDDATRFEKAGTSIDMKFLEAFDGPPLDGTRSLAQIFDNIGRSVHNQRQGNFAAQFTDAANAQLEFDNGSGVDEMLTIERMDF